MATDYAPKLSPILMTPDPHYIPGYGGYCPRYKFMLGQTYGRHTSQLLTGPAGAHPGRRLLQPNRYSPRDSQEEEDGPGGGVGWKHPPLGHSVIPGYTGFIPRAQNHFAKSYSEICKEAGSEFARQVARQVGRRQAWQRLAPGRGEGGPPPESQLPTASAKAARTPVVAAAAPPMMRCSFPPLPYSLERSNPQRYFIPGFTGFVPRARYLFGASYPVITHRALAEFDRRLRKTRPEGSPESSSSSSSSQERQEGGQALPPLAKAYPTDRGLLPHYKGYVPGYKFQFGHTYGQLTHNALGQSTLEKQIQGVLS